MQVFQKSPKEMNEIKAIQVKRTNPTQTRIAILKAAIEGSRVSSLSGWLKKSASAGLLLGLDRDITKAVVRSWFKIRHVTFESEFDVLMDRSWFNAEQRYGMRERSGSFISQEAKKEVA